MEESDAEEQFEMVENGSSDSDNDTLPWKQSAGKDVFQLFAEKLRDHKDLESRWAVLQETRVEYFRGKGFVSFLKAHPELREILESDKNLEVDEIVNVLLRKSLLVRCDRVVKTVRPGMKKLSTWPAHLELHLDQVFSDNDVFFAWTFMKRQPLRQTILSFSGAVLILVLGLFPTFPRWCQILIVYTYAGALLLLLFVRPLIFGTLWIITGKRVWFLPNIFGKEATLQELFRFWPKKDEEEKPKWTARLFYAIVAVLVILLLRNDAPHEAFGNEYAICVSYEWQLSRSVPNLVQFLD